MLHFCENARSSLSYTNEFGENAMDQYTITERTTLKRLPKRGSYDREVVHGILDEAFLCHVGFVVDGQPFVIPTGYGRDGDDLFIHGSAASRMLRSLDGGIDVCVTVTLLDGLVLARSAFHHSMNYRSVVILGKASIVTDEEEKMRALLTISENIIRGRWDEVRTPTPGEMKATTVMRIPLVEVSAKIRTGPPIDDEEDYELDVWAGVLPLHIVPGEPVADARLKVGVEPSASILGYSRMRTDNERACAD
jgi:nitroimidazol reductase NimA-like FMN-containing flavoprotein (pyridoxamine 5'-phosphate oxidase superfamily)